MNYQPFQLLILFFFITLLGVSCKGDTSEKQTGEVYYFPEKNTYYDTRTANYYYSLDSAKTWDSLKYTGNDYGSALGARIALDDQPASPYVENRSHRQSYDGILLDLVNSRTALLARADSLKRVKQIAVVKPKETTIVEEEPVAEEKPKKGIKKFFNKLFGKKKDKKNE